MNRKHNALLSLMALALMLVILVCSVTGCGQTEAPGEGEIKATERFDVELSKVRVIGGWVYLVTDKQTGVQYMALETNEGVSVTPLLPGWEELEWEG